MIKVDELLYEIDLKLNNQATLQHQAFNPEDKLIALNNSQIKYIVDSLGPQNTYQLGFDAFKKRYEDLQGLVESFHDHPLEIIEVDGHLNKWEASLSTLTPQYMFYVDSYALATKGDCKKTVIGVNNDLTKHSDVQTLIANSNTRPSFEYQETFNTISKDKLELYTDGTFSFENVYVSYLRYPVLIDVEGYVKLDGTDSVNQDSEFPAYLKDTLVNMAVQELAISTGNAQALQLGQQRQQPTKE